MALVNPNIAMSFRQPEFRPRNAMAEYAQMQQIQGGQQAQELARFQLGAAQRAENVQNALNTAYSSSLDDKGNIDYNKLLPSLARSGGGSQIPGILKARAETEAARLKQQETQGKIDTNTFDLTDKKLKAAWNLIGSSTSPQAAIVEFTKGVKSGVFKAEEVAEDLQLLGSMTDPEQFLKYRRNAVGKLLDAKDQFASLIPNIARQDTGGAITSIQNNPMLPGYGEPVKGMTPITKTATIGETTAQGQLAVAQDKFAFERANPGFELKEGADGTIYAVNKRTLQAAPVTVGGAAAPAPGGAPDAAVPGTPLKGKVSKDIAVSEQQASYNIGRILDAAKEIDAAIKKDPAALKPGMGEASAASVGLSGTANVARSAQRQIVYGAQRDAIDAMLYLATGAAYNKEQREAQIDSYMPNFTDKAENIEAKRVRMLGLIQNAKVRAGKAWTPELESTVQSLMKPGASSAKPAGGNKPPAAPGASNVTQDRADANAAIAAGAPANLVRARFKQRTGQEL
jgi:hypothetical protein